MTLSRFTILLLCPLVLSACQRYVPQPLDLSNHHTLIQSRDLASAEVTEYAKRLASARSGTSFYNPTDGISLHEAEVVALFFNPQLRLARLRANVPRVGAAEAGRWEDPELQIDAERIIQSVQNPWVLGGTLGFTIPLSGRLGVEREKARAEATVVELRALAEERRVLTDLRRSWVEWSALHERAALTRQLSDELAGTAERADKLQKAGELGPLDTRLFHLDRARQIAKLRGYESDVRAAEVRLKTLLGLIVSAEVKLIPSLSLPAIRFPAGEKLNEMVTRHPRVRVAREEYEVAERSLKLEIQRQYPDLKVGGGFGTDEGDERVLFGAGLPLPLLNANRRAIAEARVHREVARVAAEAEYEQLLGDASAAAVQLDGAEGRVTFVEKELAPLADRQVEDAVRLGKAGEFSALVLLEAMRAAHEAKLEVLDARVNVAVARATAEALLDAESRPPTTTTTGTTKVSKS
jgi:outer membrane protein, heavy metal efflux system